MATMTPTTPEAAFMTPAVVAVASLEPSAWPPDSRVSVDYDEPGITYDAYLVPYDGAGSLPVTMRGA